MADTNKSVNKSYQLTVEPREVIGKKSKSLRRAGLVPGIVYGHNVQPQSVQVSVRELDHVYLHAGNTALVDLQVGETGPARKVFIHDVQRNPVSHHLQHVDFMVVNLAEPVVVGIQLVVVGESPVVERHEGVLLQPQEHLQIRALPEQIPPNIVVDVSGLGELEQGIRVSDLTIPPGVTVLTAADELVVKVTAIQLEEAPPAELEEEAAETEAAEEAETEG